LGDERCSPEWGNQKSKHPSNSCTVKGDKIVLSGKPKKMDKTDPVAFGELGY
jgi:hypothetical protein